MNATSGSRDTHTWQPDMTPNPSHRMKKHSATFALLAALSVLILGPDARAQSSSLFDVQFEANGMTYTLYDLYALRPVVPAGTLR